MKFYPICVYKKINEKNEYVCILTEMQKIYNCPINKRYCKCECFKCTPINNYI